ncbi:hypothetical protein LZ554_007387 [Drepanopeziza brunnea f. sp. 'monogermtubi']|nr:hypothetical protein LZ554_007387 [Drepanopeziza brunnea f. sp. 'monogermtubi']
MEFGYKIADGEWNEECNWTLTATEQDSGRSLEERAHIVIDASHKFSKIRQPQWTACTSSNPTSQHVTVRLCPRKCIRSLSDVIDELNGHI